MVLSLSWPGSPCRRSLFWGGLVRLCTGLRGWFCASCLQKRSLHDTRTLYPMESLDPVTDFWQGLAHLANLAGEVSHLLTDDMHALCHVPVNSHQLLAELPEQLCLLRVGMKKLAIEAGEGRAPCAGAWGSAGRGGAWWWTVQFLPLADSFWVLRRGGGVEEGGPRELADSCTGPLQRGGAVFPRSAWHLFIFSLNRKGSMNY